VFEARHIRVSSSPISWKVSHAVRFCFSLSFARLVNVRRRAIQPKPAVISPQNLSPASRRGRGAKGMFVTSSHSLTCRAAVDPRSPPCDERARLYRIRQQNPRFAGILELSDDSNRRPPPYHQGPRATGRNRWHRFWPVRAVFRNLPNCHRLPLVAPARLHKRSILRNRILDGKRDSGGRLAFLKEFGPPPCREGGRIARPPHGVEGVSKWES
jgi:hypothetical protein